MTTSRHENDAPAGYHGLAAARSDRGSLSGAGPTFAVGASTSPGENAAGRSMLRPAPMPLASSPRPLLLALLLAACSPGAALTTPGTEVLSNQAPCTEGRPPAEPDLMAWDPGSRADLNRLHKAGIVAVRYQARGCEVELEILSNCIGKGGYSYSPYSATDTKMARNTRELRAELPIGGARLGGLLKGGHVLRTDYTLVGIDALPPGTTVRAAELRGPAAECARATHVVSKVYLGGFAMAAGESRTLDAAVSLFGARAGGDDSAAAERVAREGEPEACARARRGGEPNEQCSVPLRLALMPIDPSPLPPPPPAPAAVVIPVPVPLPASMARIPPGAFQMGSSDGGFDERPPHVVTVAGFEIDLLEVTLSSYRACVQAGKCSTHGLTIVPGCNWGHEDREDHPINCVDREQAEAYCGWTGKRLPTEVEWEYAARGADGRKHPWGNEPPAAQACWNGDGNDLGRNNRRSTCPVGRYLAGRSPFGLFDMAGNVWEWTSSRYCPYPGKSCAAPEHARRGGGFLDNDVAAMRATVREPRRNGLHDPGAGFRCAR
jgi:formylglycine-generating enzyme required for sulfatase activity